MGWFKRDKKTKDGSKEIQSLQEHLGAEQAYLQKISVALKQILNTKLRTKKEVHKTIRNIFQIYKSIGRETRSVQREDTKVEDNLHDIISKIPKNATHLIEEGNNILQSLQLGDRTLVKAFSRYAGQFVAQLHIIEHEEDLILQLEEKGLEVSVQKQKLKQLIDNSLRELQDLETWVNGTIATLSNARGYSRRQFLVGMGSAAAMLLFPISVKAGVSITRHSRYSHWENNRSKRSTTKYIVLHTTEASESSSFQSIPGKGLANYIVKIDGGVSHVVPHARMAKHAGRSIFNGLYGISNYSVAIEIVSKHSGLTARLPTTPQRRALKSLIADLQGIYGVSDKNVITHPMVRYTKSSGLRQRGRHCACLLNQPAIRKELGLNDRWSYDPDFETGKTIWEYGATDNASFYDTFAFADDSVPSRRKKTYAHARKVRKGMGKRTSPGPEPEPDKPKVKRYTCNGTITRDTTAWDICGPEYDTPNVVYTLPDGRKIRGDEVTNWKRIVPGTKVSQEKETERGHERNNEFIVLKQGDNPFGLFGAEYDDETTIYFLLDGRIKKGSDMSKGDFKSLAPGTKILLDYIWIGRIPKGKGPAYLLNKYGFPSSLYRDPSTLYRFPNKQVMFYDEYNKSTFPIGTIVFIRKDK